MSSESQTKAPQESTLRRISRRITKTSHTVQQDTIVNQRGNEWAISFLATLSPFALFCYSHHLGITSNVLNRVARSPMGVYGFLALPIVTLAMEKSIYDTVQSIQGVDPNVVTGGNRGGFPSGGAELPSFSLVAVRRKEGP
eukprot:CAMPEP_0194324096 /NCGR_PEP_ID=MMETSP0171-20130528/26497_1 /TAXON_ID=218684 /ORGANISM="Corethron pennatum, Strain L29A3" /LENGTH=140 /DNA_ID=CAMNT_0039082907 /DNA_START=61 /DNA_END=483 /DNA_ORIENTATION=+